MNVNVGTLKMKCCSVCVPLVKKRLMEQASLAAASGRFGVKMLPLSLVVIDTIVVYC
jgi:hypothetical protein